MTFMSSSLFDSSSAMQVSGRGGAAIVILTHLIRSVFFDDRKSTRALREEIINFRTEVLKAEQLVHRTNIALESCLSVSGFQAKVIEAGLIIVVQISVVVIFWWTFCRREKKTELVEAQSESDSEVDRTPKSEPRPLCDIKTDPPFAGYPLDVVNRFDLLT